MSFVCCCNNDFVNVSVIRSRGWNPLLRKTKSKQNKKIPRGGGKTAAQFDTTSKRKVLFNEGRLRPLLLRIPTAYTTHSACVQAYATSYIKHAHRVKKSTKYRADGHCFNLM